MKKLILPLSIIILLLSGCGSQPEINNGELRELTVIKEDISNVFEEPDILSKRLGQFLFNEKITIIEKRDLWIKVKNEELEGYISKSDIYTDTFTENELSPKYKIIITEKEKKIYINPSQSIVLKNVFMGTILYSGELNNNMYVIDMPGKIKGWITNRDIIVLNMSEEIQKTSAYDFAETAKRLKGVEYIDNGRSSHGIDNFGLIELSLFLNGYEWNKDIESLNFYDIVEDNNYKPGDILFITNKYNEDFCELGIYIGNDEYISASKSRGYVVINKVSNLLYTQEIKKAIRIFI